MPRGVADGALRGARAWAERRSQLRHVVRSLTPLHPVDLLVVREGDQAYVDRVVTHVCSGGLRDGVEDWNPLDRRESGIIAL